MVDGTAIPFEKIGSMKVAMIVDETENIGTVEYVELVPSMSVNLLLVRCLIKKEMETISTNSFTNLN